MPPIPANQLDRIEAKVDRLELIAAKQELNLQEHMRRTELLERAIVPLQAHVAFAGAAAKVLGALLAAAGVVFGAAQIWLSVKH